MGAVAELLNEIRSWRKSVSTSRRQLIRDRDPLKEVADPVPMEVPVGYETPPTMQELIQQYVRQEVSAQAQADNLGTFEEEDDFEIDDPDDIVLSGYEVNEYAMAEEEAPNDPAEPQTAPEAPEEPQDPSAEPSANEGDAPTEKPQ